MTSTEPTLPGKIRRKVRDKGLAGAAGGAVRRFVYKRTVSLYLERELSLPRKLRPRQGIEVAQITGIDPPRYRKHLARHVEAYRGLLDQGCVGFAASLDGDIVGTGWWAVNDYFDSDVYQCSFPVAPGQVYQFAGELAPEYRGTSISLMVLIAAWNHLIETGHTRVYSISSLANPTALKWHRHLAFAPNGLALDTHKVLTKTWSKTRPLRDEEHAEWERLTARKRRPRPPAASR